VKVCILGLGNVGLPSAKYSLARALDVYGYDVSGTAISRAFSEGIRATSKWDDIPEAEIYIVCVSSADHDCRGELTAVQEACGKIATKGRRTLPLLVSVESTVVPGTCRRIFEDIFDGKIPLVHVPHRYWSRNSAEHGVRQRRVIGGVDETSLRVGREFYGNTLDIPLDAVSSIEVAEMCKISENAYRYVQIAFAEQLRIICHQVDLDYDEVREACNTKWNIEILEARDGIRGGCLQKDILHLDSLTNQGLLLQSAQEIDKRYREWINAPGSKGKLASGIH
jgi:UDP-N-acetyl-D-mannosaminuronic acid dehydrogenase